MKAIAAVAYLKVIDKEAKCHIGFGLRKAKVAPTTAHAVQDMRLNLKKGDLVLLKDNQVKRNEWPMDLITKTFPKQDGKVRKIQLKVTRSGSAKTFLRPVSQTILLKKAEDTE